MKADIVIYTDASVGLNSCSAGVAFKASHAKEGEELVFAKYTQTKNKTITFFEFLAAYLAIKSVNNKGISVQIFSDCKVLVESINGIDSRSCGKRDYNILVGKIRNEIKSKRLKVEAKWVKSHSGNKENEIVDLAARKAMRSKSDFKRHVKVIVYS